MIHEHLNELRSVVNRSHDLPEATRSELLKLVAELEQETTNLDGRDEARSQAAASDDASSQESHPAKSLVSAIEGLEASHPELAAAVSNTASMLSRLGF